MIDVKAAAEKMGLSEEELTEIVRLFIEVSQEDLTKLQSAIEHGNARETFEVSHSIKGAAVNLGFEDIAEVARGIELDARQDSLAGAVERYAILKEKIDLLSDSI